MHRADHIAEDLESVWGNLRTAVIEAADKDNTLLTRVREFADVLIRLDTPTTYRLYEQTKARIIARLDQLYLPMYAALPTAYDRRKAAEAARSVVMRKITSRLGHLRRGATPMQSALCDTGEAPGASQAANAAFLMSTADAPRDPGAGSGGSSSAVVMQHGEGVWTGSCGSGRLSSRDADSAACGLPGCIGGHPPAQPEGARVRAGCG